MSEILKIPPEQWTPIQKDVITFSPEIVLRCKQNKEKRDRSKARLEEVNLLLRNSTLLTVLQVGKSSTIQVKTAKLWTHLP